MLTVETFQVQTLQDSGWITQATVSNMRAAAFEYQYLVSVGHIVRTIKA